MDTGHEYCKQGIIALNTISTISSEDCGVNSSDSFFLCISEADRKNYKKVILTLTLCKIDTLNLVCFHGLYD